jgi:hypothetical protein
MGLPERLHSGFKIYDAAIVAAVDMENALMCTNKSDDAIGLLSETLTNFKEGSQ